MSSHLKTLRRLGSALLAAAVAISATVALTAAAADETVRTDQPRMRRLTESQYRRTIGDLFGRDIGVTGRFEPDMRVGGLLAVGAGQLSVTASGLEQYEELARNIATQVTARSHRDKLVGCGPGPGDPQGARCAASFLNRVGLRLYRRPLTPVETRALAGAAMAASGRLGDFDAGLAAALTGMLTNPEFLFRIDAPGRSGEIDGYSKATRLSYLLWNTTPDAELLDAAGRGELDTADGLARQVDRLMTSPRYIEGVRAFFTDFLQLDEMDGLSKDALIYPVFTPTVASAAREQTLRTITDLLVNHDGDYRDLFTTRRIAMNRALGPLYDIPVASDGWYMHEFPAGDPRAGLLTQASLLALHSHPGRTSPTLRGKAIREILLCEKVPTPPANVNFAVVQDVNNPTLKTTRARLKAHLDDDECASCHKRTDPIGLGLEQFDGVGQFRTTEHDQMIDVTGNLDGAAFDGAAELGQRMHQSDEASACLVRTAWRYANGREPLAADLPRIEALVHSFEAGGQRFSGLMRALVLDPDFYRAPGTRPRRQTAEAANRSGRS